MAKKVVSEEVDFLHTRHGALLLLLALLDKPEGRSRPRIDVNSLIKLIRFAQLKIAPAWTERSVSDQEAQGHQAIFFPFLSYSLDQAILEEELIGDLEMLMAEAFVYYQPSTTRPGVVVLPKTHSFWANFFSTICFADRIIIANFANLLLAVREEGQPK